ncbi:kynureninase [Halobacteriales archaeon QS_9_67_17]|nr:MAG: kynureninase [Halobacteriales archaeon QS_9_67_17]
MEAPEPGFGSDGREAARAADARDPLASFAHRFDVSGTYMDGNSLGPLSEDSEAVLDRVVEEWRDHAVEGWTEGDPDWFRYGERLGAKVSPLVGARESEVAVCGSTTVNIHTLVGTFYDEVNSSAGGSAGDANSVSGAATADDPGSILVNDLDFPTDHYAIRAQLRQRGLDPDDHLTVVESRDGQTIARDDVERALREEDVDLLFFPAVLYRSGQLFDIAALTDLAHEHGALAGFDLAHSVGVVPHDLHDAGVDFAVWCHYKYLNAGPGAVAGLYCHEDHFGIRPALGTVPVLAAAPLDGALDVTREAGIDAIRAKSVALTDYLVALVDRLPDAFAVGSPRDPERRGGHVAVEHPEAYRLTQALKDRDVVVDFRPPNVIRVAPAPLYTGFEDVFDVAETLRALHESGAHEEYEPRSGGVT